MEKVCFIQSNREVCTSLVPRNKSAVCQRFDVSSHKMLSCYTRVPCSGVCDDDASTLRNRNRRMKVIRCRVRPPNATAVHA
jgi:hypothetical protein